MNRRKYLCLILGLLCLALVLSACGTGEPAFELEGLSVCPASEGEAPEGLTMTVKSFDGTEIQLRLKNSSGEDYTFGEPYHLDYAYDGAWYRIPYREEIREDGPVYDALLSLLDAGTEKNWSRDIAGEYGQLPPGRYRMVKSLTNNLTGQYENLTAEFTVK